MDIRVLRYFLAVAKEGNITKAAENLHITQPTLSRQMIELEEEMGTSLFIRGKRQITLTNNGILFQQRAKEIVSLIDKTERDMSEQNDLVGGVISIGCVESIASQALPKVLAEFVKVHPMVKYELYSADGDDIREKIDRDDIDMGILLEPIEAAKYDYIRLPFYEQWGIVMKKSDPLAKKKAISVENILEVPLIVPRRTIVQDEIAKWLGVTNDKLNIVASHNLLTNALLLVQNDMGYAICVRGAYSIRETDNICFVPFEPGKTTGHVLAWKKNQIFNSATSLFIQFLKDIY
ncbi:LysR family transcriptional regulator [Anaerocolumna xylanovorans]|uniref:DNA-binding transcriptional regulator, LysR family n=1 Tax=Anaerocolumna xylanovorans DSM 12503 TaxID=1121345 RepID=A0A1M7YIC9_9FIRM|nr:LysR family transcriptional regulator [Anaerocolumna xylanovorans]SHO52350.1 DNA-binding transcriptional regulator, LysR family [Anaerocolumna xylanovorans DSM 12503]